MYPELPPKYMSEEFRNNPTVKTKATFSYRIKLVSSIMMEDKYLHAFFYPKKRADLKSTRESGAKTSTLKSYQKFVSCQFSESNQVMEN